PPKTFDWWGGRATARAFYGVFGEDATYCDLFWDVMQKYNELVRAGFQGVFTLYRVFPMTEAG
ncbi:hypothetical protein, partial [uncultured Bilophila sp.]|uniref:hypothetical protein n=1 Tax=uncultured Bilophila sp. TaxID=529385 RepID=UPI00280B8DDF